MDPIDPVADATARPVRPALVPELRLELSDDVMGLWEASESDAPPFWASAWPGGQALARYLLDRPELVRGRTVLDLASGSGIVGLAASLAGAARVTAVDVDPAAGEALARNLALNPQIGGAVEFVGRDILDEPPIAFDLVCAGDVCYEGAMARRMVRWLVRTADAGIEVLVGDPGRSYFPTDPAFGLVASYEVEADPVMHGTDRVVAGVYRLERSPAPPASPPAGPSADQTGEGR
jgi:predicted nicotinamide N-methyase